MTTPPTTAPLELTPEPHVPEWVTVACSDDKEFRPKLAQPWEFEFDGETWTIGTNGHLAVLARGSFGAKKATDPDGPGVSFTTITPLPPVEHRVSTPVDLDDFRRWLGFDATQPTCTVCKGFGEFQCHTCNGEGEVECECDCGHEHERTCDACGGVGKRKCPKCYPSSRDDDRGFVFGQLVNRTLFRRAFVKLPYHEGVWHRDTRSSEKPIHITGDDWHVIVMPLRCDAFRERTLKDAPRFGEVAAS